MGFIEYIIGRFTIQPINYITDRDGQRKDKGVEVVEGLLRQVDAFKTLSFLSASTIASNSSLSNPDLRGLINL